MTVNLWFFHTVYIWDTVTYQELEVLQIVTVEVVGHVDASHLTTTLLPVAVQDDGGQTTVNNYWLKNRKKLREIKVKPFNRFCVKSISENLEVIFKTAILGTLNVVNMVIFNLQKVQKIMKIKIRSLQMCFKNGRFCNSKIPKIDFT